MTDDYELLQRILDQILDLVLYFDDQGRIVSANRAWLERFGYAPEEILRLVLWELSEASAADRIRKTFLKVSAEGEAAAGIDLPVAGPDGLPVLLKGKLYGWSEPGGTARYVFGVFREAGSAKPVSNGTAGSETGNHPPSDGFFSPEELERMAESERQFRAMLRSAPFGIFTLGSDGLFRSVSSAISKLTGYPGEELIGTRAVDLIHPGFREQAAELFRLAHTSGSAEADLPIIAREGSRLWVNVTAVRFGSGELLGFCWDITGRKRAEEAVFEDRERFRTTLLSVGDGVIATDGEGIITVINPIAEALTGWKAAEAIGCSLRDVFVTIHEYSRETVESPVWEVLNTGNSVDIGAPVLLMSRSGQEIHIEESSSPIRDSRGRTVGAVMVFRDFTEKKEKQRQIEYLSFHDHLTGLYNRRYFEDSIRRMDIRRNFPFTLMVLDVNGLKLTNDAFGHDVGDRLLMTVADAIRRACRADDIIARIGGDEFALLLPNTSAVQAEEVRKRLLESCAACRVGSIIVSVAVGFGVKTEADQDIFEILKQADYSMYRDKLATGGAVKSRAVKNMLKEIYRNHDREEVHVSRVFRYSVAIARAMGMRGGDIDLIRRVSTYHDIGKIIVPPEVLKKREQLTPVEREIVRRHPEAGYQILKAVDEYAPLAEIVLHHHEWWNGEGYPKGLKEDEIPLMSRILAVAEAYEVMTAQRGYRERKSDEEALRELERCAGTQFDAEVVAAFAGKVFPRISDVD